MALSIKIENFEGPFDLLLHLIKKNEMNIYDIKIFEITNQYMEYIKSMKELDLDIASEFIVTAATLLEIKSRELLPKEKKENDEEIDEEDIKKQLIDKLIEYRNFKEAAGFFKERQEKVGIMFTKKPEIIVDKSEPDISDVLKNITLYQLYNMFNELIFIYNSKINIENREFKQIPADIYKIEDKMEQLNEYINKNKKGEFSHIIEKCTCKIEIIVTFLALLEMIKLRTISIVQENNFKEIYLERICEDEQ